MTNIFLLTQWSLREIMISIQFFSKRIIILSYSENMKFAETAGVGIWD